MSHRDTDLCLQEEAYPPSLWAVFRGEHFILAYAHPEPARLRSLRFREEGQVVRYVPDSTTTQETARCVKTS